MSFKEETFPPETMMHTAFGDVTLIVSEHMPPDKVLILSPKQLEDCVRAHGPEAFDAAIQHLANTLRA